MPHRLIFPSLAADALSLGPHWIYNPDKIDRLYPETIQRYDAPHSSYHPGKQAGDLTHYGDQTLALLRSIALRGTFDADGWREDWQRFWLSGPPSYRDAATKATLAHLADPASPPSTSDDLAGASRIAPILASLSAKPLDARISACRAQVALTHGDPATIDAAEFFARAVDHIQHGHPIPLALAHAADSPYQALDARALLDAAQTALATGPAEAAAQLGLTCHTHEAFPLTLHLALRYADAPRLALTQNAMVGGDSAARGLLIGLLMGAAHGTSWMPRAWLDELRQARQIEALLTLLAADPTPSSSTVSIPHPDGHQLAGVLDLPSGPPAAFALFAHCFTCGKNLRGATRIARLLASEGIATLRFDFTGIGESQGDFSGTSFLSNVEDIRIAADWLRDHHRAPALLIGHSLGGSAVLAAAHQIPESLGVVTIGAPFDPAHVTHLLADDLDTIRRDGKATVSIAGRDFTIGARFLEDLEDLSHRRTIGSLGRDLLVMHSPIDDVVSIGQAGEIYSAARHPKSFHSLADADHLLSDPRHADYAATLIAAWASRFVAD